MPAGEVDLNASVDDNAWSSSQPEPEKVWVEENSVVEHDIELSSNRVSVAGVVLDAARVPVHEADIWAWADSGDGFEFSTNGKTKEDGTFELFVDPAPGVLYQLWAQRGPLSQSVQGIVPGASWLEVILPELGELRLEVLDVASAEPIEGFELAWRTDRDQSFRDLYQGDNTFSPGPDGTFLAQLPVGTLELSVSARELGYPEVRVGGVQVTHSASARPERILLTRGVTVDVVFDFEGQTEGLTEPQLRRGRLYLATDEQVAAGQRYGRQHRIARNAQAIRKRDEGYQVRGIAPGVYSVRHSRNLEVVFKPDKIKIPAVDRHEIRVRVAPKPPEEDAAEK